MINSDFLSLSNLRCDGRKSAQIRNTVIHLGIKTSADGSCLLKQGLTEVLCVVRGPYQKTNPNDNLLRMEYTVAPFSSLEKRRNKYDRDFSVFAQNIRKSFQSIIIAENYSKSQIEITVTVIQNQGSAKSTVMNCISIALANAGICIRDIMVSSTVGQLNNTIIADPNDEEEYDINNELVVSYINGSKKVDCVELKDGKIMENQLKQLYSLAIETCKIFYYRLRKALVDHSQKKILVF